MNKSTLYFIGEEHTPIVLESCTQPECVWYEIDFWDMNVTEEYVWHEINHGTKIMGKYIWKPITIVVKDNIESFFNWLNLTLKSSSQGEICKKDVTIDYVSEKDKMITSFILYDTIISNYEIDDETLIVELQYLKMTII